MHGSIARSALLLLFTVALACPAVARDDLALLPSLQAEPLKEVWAKEWWIPRHLEKLDAANDSDATLVFIGDSITQGWEEDGAGAWAKHFAGTGFNLGFSGDRTENILWRLQNGEVDALDAKVTVLLAGTNNTGHRMDPAAHTALGIQTIIAEIKQRQPDSHIVLLAIFPRGMMPDEEMRVRNNEINRLIEANADGDRVHFLDLAHLFTNDQGVLKQQIMPDLLHLNAEGYALWAEAMLPLLTRLATEK